jgi:hypothetical protein
MPSYWPHSRSVKLLQALQVDMILKEGARAFRLDNQTNVLKARPTANFCESGFRESDGLSSQSFLTFRGDMQRHRDET